MDVDKEYDVGVLVLEKGNFLYFALCAPKMICLLHIAVVIW